MKTDPLNKTILVIDSDISSRFLLETLFKQKYKLLSLVYVNPNIELIKALQIQPDLIFIEFYTGRCNYGLIKKVKACKPQVPLVALTACAMNDEKEMSLKAGCNYFISKPINSKRFLDLAHKILHN